MRQFATVEPPKYSHPKTDRASCRMIGALAKQPAWVESLSAESRQAMVEKLVAMIPTVDSAREAASLAKALAQLEGNDIARTRLLMDHEEAEAATQDENRLADSLRQAVAEIRAQEAT